MTYIKEIGKTTWWKAKASTFTKMVIYLLEITLMTKEKDKENWFTLMEMYIRVSGKTICKMIWMHSFYILMEIFILASFRMVSFRELGKFRLWKKEFMRENSRMEKLMVSERWIFKTVLRMKGNGWMIRFMEKEDWLNKVWIFCLKENSKIIKKMGLG